MANIEKVNLEENSPYRVAYDLANRIARVEGNSHEGKPRKYYLNLYRQCFNVVYHGESYENVKDFSEVKE